MKVRSDIFRKEADGNTSVGSEPNSGIFNSQGRAGAAQMTIRCAAD
jgi:hypothetical protein